MIWWAYQSFRIRAETIKISYPNSNQDFWKPIFLRLLAPYYQKNMPPLVWLLRAAMQNFSFRDPFFSFCLISPFWQSNCHSFRSFSVYDLKIRSFPGNYCNCSIRAQMRELSHAELKKTSNFFWWSNRVLNFPYSLAADVNLLNSVNKITNEGARII